MSKDFTVYSWLLDKINNNEVILTVSKLLARDLINEYDKSQLRQKKNSMGYTKNIFLARLVETQISRQFKYRRLVNYR